MIKAMFEVKFQYDEPASAVVTLFSSKIIEEAIQFSLALHRSSNVPHLIAVVNLEDKSESVVFQLKRK